MLGVLLAIFGGASVVAIATSASKPKRPTPEGAPSPLPPRAPGEKWRPVPSIVLPMTVVLGDKGSRSGTLWFAIRSLYRDNVDTRARFSDRHTGADVRGRAEVRWWRKDDMIADEDGRFVSDLSILTPTQLGRGTDGRMRYGNEIGLGWIRITLAIAQDGRPVAQLQWGTAWDNVEPRDYFTLSGEARYK